MARTPDYYAALGLPETATARDVREAYKKRALRTHPDKNPNDASAAEAFKEVGAAYACLSDAAARREYDAERRGGGGAAGPFAARGGGGRDDPFATRDAPGFDTSFDAFRRDARTPWGSGRSSFSMDDARAQFDRFFGTASPWGAAPAPPDGARKVTQISTIRRADGRLESMTRTRSDGANSYDYFNQGHVLHGGRGHVVDVDVQELPYGGDARRAAAARDRNAVREIMGRRAAAERGERVDRGEGRPFGRRETAPAALSADPFDELTSRFSNNTLAVTPASSRRSNDAFGSSRDDDAMARRLAGAEAANFWT